MLRAIPLLPKHKVQFCTTEFIPFICKYLRNKFRVTDYFTSSKTQSTVAFPLIKTVATPSSFSTTNVQRNLSIGI